MLKGLDAVERNLDRWYREGILKRAAEVMQEICSILENHAKTHHDWQPDTGATDNSTKAFISDVTPRVITAVLTAGMEYDVFLELARDGKWAWLWPAIEDNLDLIRSKLESITQ